IDALSLAAGGDNSFGVSGGSAVGAGTGAVATPAIPPIATITALGSTNVKEGYDWEGPEYKFSLGNLDANGVNNLVSRPTTYTFSLSGVEKGVDYEEIETPDGNFIFEYKDANGDWVPMYGNKLTVNDPRDIENLEIRIAHIANNSIQNQGERVGDDPMFSGIDGAIQGVYQRKATVNVTSDNPQIASSSNTGTITETDDNISFTKGLDGQRVMTFIGDDTINLYGDVKNSARVESGNDNDVINLYGNLTTGSTINTGSEDVFSEVARDIVNVKSGASVNGATLASEGVATFNIEKGATLNNAHINHMYGSNQTVNVNGTLNETEMSLGTGNNKITLDGATSTNKLRVETQSGDDDIVIKNSKILGDENLIGNHNVMDIRSGQNTVTAENSQLSRLDIQANGGASDKTTITLNATKGERLNITGQDEEDVFALKGGSTLTSSGVNLGNGKNTIDVDGAKITTASLITGSNDDIINLKNAELKNVNVETGQGKNEVNIENVTSDNTKITLGGSWSNGDNTVNIKGNFGDVDANSYNKTAISSYGSAVARDFINIADNANVHNVRFDLNQKSDKITIGENATVSHSQLITGDDNDTLEIGDGANISKGTHMDLGFHSDTAKIGNNVTIDDSDIYMDDGDTTHQSTFGNDTVTIGNNVTFKNYADVKGGQGNDTITIGDNLTLDGNAGIYGDWGEGGGGVNNATDGNDTITIGNNLTVKNNSTVSGGGGDDVISIGKNASIQDTSTIDGGAGFDTLKVADNSIDFSHVKNIEKLDMTNGEKTTLSLTASNVQDILRDSNENKLKIDGDSNDELTLGSSWTKGASSGGYTTYTSGTTTIEVQDQIHVL
ncbi:beta strand repeat-containing protein, partial [Campylobacter concisus]